MEQLFRDIAFAVRALARAPGFALIASLTLAVGIGANTAIYSVVKAVLLRPLPYETPENLTMIWRGEDNGLTTWLSASEIRSYGAESHAIEDVAAYETITQTLTGNTDPERVNGARVTPNLFRTLRVRALAGRLFAAEDSVASPGRIAVISEGLWRRRFGGETSLIGRDIVVNGENVTVIGVASASLRLPLDYRSGHAVDLWTTLSLNEPDLEGWGNRGLIGIARLRPGTSAAAADGELYQIEARWVREGLLKEGTDLHRSVIPVQDFVSGDVRRLLFVLAGSAGVILLIVCANVASLTVARANERQREVTIRSALGASRGQLVRQFLTESAILSLVGAAVGVALAYLALDLLVALHPPGVPRLDETVLDSGALIVALALAVATTAVFGLAPALALSRTSLAASLQAGGRSSSAGRGTQRLRDVLASTQVALSVMLLVGAALLLRTFEQLNRVNLGFKTDNALTFRLTTSPATYAHDQDVSRFFASALDRLGRIQGVEAVGATRLLPLTGTIGDWSITIEGRAKAPDENPNGDWQVVTPGYFEAMRIRLLNGRLLNDEDVTTAPLSAVINEPMATKYWGSASAALGRRFHLGTATQPWATIVGVVAPVRHNAIVEAPRPEMYLAHAQWSGAGGSVQRGMTFVLRTAGEPLALVGAVRASIHQMDASLPVSEIRTLRHVADEALAVPRFATVLLSLFAALALTLATIGLYGVISLLVARRRHEIGIRMALGATRASIQRMVLARGTMLAASGIAAGLAGAIASTRVLASILYGVTPFDLATFIAVPILIAAVALLACLLPATRAASISPVIALRDA